MKFKPSKTLVIINFQTYSVTKQSNALLIYNNLPTRT
jgi:hypothetical protein